MAYERYRCSRPAPIRGVLFDMDGIVLDSETLYTRFWMEAIRELGFPMTREQALGLRSLNHQRGAEYLRRCFGPGLDYDAARAIRIRRMDAWIAVHGVAPKPGIFRLLDALEARGLPCALTTSSPPERVKAHLTPPGLYHRFGQICCGCQVAHGKPEPDLYLFGAARLGLPPESCLALEDSPAGIESAFRAGCLPVVIPDQDQPGPEVLERCLARADSLEDVIALIDDLAAGEN